jgi:hypothetical protein
VRDGKSAIANRAGGVAWFAVRAGGDGWQKGWQWAWVGGANGPVEEVQEEEKTR